MDLQFGWSSPFSTDHKMGFAVSTWGGELMNGRTSLVRAVETRDLDDLRSTYIYIWGHFTFYTDTPRNVVLAL